MLSVQTSQVSEETVTSPLTSVTDVKQVVKKKKDDSLWEAMPIDWLTTATNWSCSPAYVLTLMCLIWYTALSASVGYLYVCLLWCVYVCIVKAVALWSSVVYGHLSHVTHMYMYL